MTASLFKSLQVSRTLLSILADLNNCMVSIHPLISKSPLPCTSPLMIVQRASIIIGITVTFMFHSFFNCLARSWYLSLFAFLQLYPVVSRKVYYLVGSLFLLTITRSDYYHYYSLIRVFHISVCRWFFTGV